MSKLYITLSLNVKRRGVTRAMLRSYLKDAIENWGGQFFPGGEVEDGGWEDPDPLFYGLDKVTVTRIGDSVLPEATLVKFKRLHDVLEAIQTLPSAARNALEAEFPLPKEWTS